MYHESLITPHPQLQPNATPERFVDIAGLADIPAYLRDAARYGEATYNRATVSAAEHIQWTIRNSLYFQRGIIAPASSGEGTQTTLDTLEQEQVTNCLGFTIAGSEALEAVGIPHVVAYANGHVFSALVLERQGRPYLQLADMLSPELNQDLSATLRSNNASGILSQTQDPLHPRGVAKIDTTILAANLNTTVENLSQHPWLSYDTSNKTPYVGWHEETGLKNRHQIVMSAYAPRIGRQVLSQYVDLQAAIAQQDSYRATAVLVGLHGLLPDIDARSGHREIRQTVALLQSEGRHTTAARAVKAYCASFYRTRDARISELEGSLLHAIGETAEAPHVVAKACVAYERALFRSRQPWATQAIRRRLQAAKQLLAAFQTTTITGVEAPAVA